MQKSICIPTDMLYKNEQNLKAYCYPLFWYVFLFSWKVIFWPARFLNFISCCTSEICKRIPNTQVSKIELCWRLQALLPLRWEVIRKMMLCDNRIEAEKLLVTFPCLEFGFGLERTLASKSEIKNQSPVLTCFISWGTSGKSFSISFLQFLQIFNERIRPIDFKVLILFQDSIVISHK